MKIKYDLQVFHNIVLFKVLEMDEKYRSEDNKILELFSSTNGIGINSESCVGLYDNFVYILGKHSEEENTTDFIRFGTSKEAQEYADKVRFTLEEWNNHVDIMEIEYRQELKIKTYENNTHKVVMDGSMLMTYKINSPTGGTIMIDGIHIANKDLSDEDIIKLFNCKCELLNIPFRLK